MKGKETNALLNSTELKKFCELNLKEKHFLIKVGKQINLLLEDMEEF